MKRCKAISKVVIFILLFVIIYWKVSSVLSIGTEFTETVGSYRSFYSEPEDSLQIVTLGNSRMYFGWNSLQLWQNKGITSYSVGTGKQPAVMLKYLMEEVRKTQKDPLFIVDISCFRQDQIYDMNDVIIRRVADCMPYSSNKVDMIEAVLEIYPKALDYQIEKTRASIEKAKESLEKAMESREKAQLKSEIKENETKLAELIAEKDKMSAFNYYWNFPTYHSRWSDLKKNDFTGEGNLFKSVLESDQVFKVKAIKEPIYTDKCSNLDDIQKNILVDLLSYIEKNNLKVLFVSMPANLKEEYSMQLNTVMDLIKDKGQACLNFNTKNMYKKLGLAFKTDFKDNDHMNVYGSKKYMTYMESYLTKHYSLTDQRGKAGYESWDRAVKDYAAYVTEMQEELTK